MCIVSVCLPPLSASLPLGTNYRYRTKRREGSKGPMNKNVRPINKHVLGPFIFVYWSFLPSFPSSEKKGLLVSQWLDGQQHRVSFVSLALLFARMPEWAHVLSKREQRGQGRKAGRTMIMRSMEGRKKGKKGKKGQTRSWNEITSEIDKQALVCFLPGPARFSK